MTDEVSLLLPLPPTVNAYYGVVPGTQRRYLTKAAKAFRHDVAVIIEQKGLRGRFPPTRGVERDLMLHVVLHLKSGGDVDNRNKSLLDALQEANLFTNDRQFKRLVCDIGHPIAGGRCHVTIRRT